MQPTKRIFVKIRRMGKAFFRDFNLSPWSEWFTSLISSTQKIGTTGCSETSVNKCDALGNTAKTRIRKRIVLFIQRWRHNEAVAKRSIMEERKKRKKAKRGRHTWTLVRVLKFGFASSKGAFVLQDFSPPPRCSCRVRSSGMLRSVDLELVTQAVQGSK